MSQIRLMIEEIEKAVSDDEYTLTEWEEGFLDSIKRQEARGPLSEKQENVLTQIWERAKGYGGH